MIFLGIDPGSVRVGYGFIEKSQGELIYRESGLIPLPLGLPKNQNLNYLESSLATLIKKSRPDLIGIEKLYFSKNQKTAIEVAQARGVIINLVGKLGIPFRELTPTAIKLAAAGNGRATKAAITKMVLLSLKNSSLIETKIDDPLDALAVAIAVSQEKLTPAH